MTVGPGLSLCLEVGVRKAVTLSAGTACRSYDAITWVACFGDVATNRCVKAPRAAHLRTHAAPPHPPHPPHPPRPPLRPPLRHRTPHPHK